MATEVRMPSTPREQAYTAIGILALIGAGAYWMYVYSPKVTEHLILESRISVLDKNNQVAKAEIAKGSVDELREQAAAYADNLVLMRQLVPGSNEVPELLEQVSTAARRAGLDIGPVDVLPIEHGADFTAHKYRLSINGPFHAVAEFLTNVGSLRRIVTPTNVIVRALPPTGAGRGRAAGPPPTSNASFEVHTYVARSAPPAQGGQ